MPRIKRQSFYSALSLGSLIIGLTMGTVACQQGKKEDGQSQAYADVLEKCDLLEKQLEREKVNLQETPAKASELGEKLEFALTTTPQESKVQSLLEQYILISQKLLDVGDTKVVLFPEKDRVQKSLNNALVYLGYLYAKSEGQGLVHPIQNKNLDYAEFSYRFARYNFFLNTLKNFNVPIDNVNKATQAMDQLKNEHLNKIITMSTVSITDIFLIRTLSEKNKNWQLGPGLNIFTNEETNLALAELAWNYREQAKALLKSRETKKAEAVETGSAPGSP